MTNPIKIDCKNLRLERQRENNNLMFRALITQDADLVKHHCNINELNRVLAELNEILILKFSLEDLLHKCEEDHIYAKTLAGRISKMTSRQATKDEAYILSKCNETLSQVGIEVENLTTTALRPTKDGRLLDNNEYKKSGLKKSDCLKSIDAHISGKIHGLVFAKVAFGSGGHQDNVFAEAHEFGEWAQKYGNKNRLFVILIDTDLTTQFEELRDKFGGSNILVCNHYEFQRRLLNWAAQRTPSGGNSVSGGTTSNS